ncbi:hypothetical protein D187_001791 [Cystobacter fuscus DSM 2262]|uniref:Uncharacterized protein n=1 Tax=Cystobacter fuscus (strain ATCC 25194 / DSM 2262 / NBRC 100088 / M29) TaxID=1242864 RepID=S9PE93_CYSF2|nr:hypothetical protein D187_001791 [Cystobacter fuscus DSM 2262]
MVRRTRSTGPSGHVGLLWCHWKDSTQTVTEAGVRLRCQPPLVRGHVGPVARIPSATDL